MSDFCYSWPKFNRIFHQVELMDRMMEVVGVNPATAARLAATRSCGLGSARRLGLWTSAARTGTGRSGSGTGRIRPMFILL